MRHDFPDVTPIDGLALTLFALASDQSVRVMEALAAAITNRAGLHPAGSNASLPDDVQQAKVIGQTRTLAEPGPRLVLCRRIARRALRGTLVDPSGGATAFHRVEASPSWSQNLLPVAMLGPFLFYRP
ncbi:MAG: cell wall hydrolase [Geminicoccaceae bacterium]